MTKLSIIAASAILGSSLLFTGCGSSSSDSVAAAAGGSAEVQGSVVNKILAGGLVLTFDANTSCINTKTVTAPTEIINFNSTDFNSTSGGTCQGSLASDFNISVSPSSSYAIGNVGDDSNTTYNWATGINELNVSTGNGVGLAKFNGIKGIKVNFASTLAIANNEPVIDVDVNDESDSVMITLKKLIQGKMATNVFDPTQYKDINYTAMASGDFNSSMIPTAIFTDLGITDATQFDTISTAIATAIAAGTSTDLSVIADDLNITGLNNLVSSITDAATAETLSVSSVSLTVGDDAWAATENEFTIVKADTQDVNATDDVVLSLNAIGFNKFAVSSTLKAVVKTDTDTLTVTLNGVSIATSEAGVVSATVAAGSILDLTSSYDDIASISGTIDSEMTTSDLSFSLNDLIAGISVNTSAITAVKDDIIAALAKAKTYDVAVGLSGITTEITNLESNITCLGIGYLGYQGTVTVGASTPDTNTTTPTTGTSYTVVGPLNAMGIVDMGSIGDISSEVSANTMTVMVSNYKVGTDSSVDISAARLYIATDFISKDSYITGTVISGGFQFEIPTDADLSTSFLRISDDELGNVYFELSNNN